MVELDYKTVKKEVWYKFLKIYRGGPSIVRDKPFIYAAAVEDIIDPSNSPSATKPPNQATLARHKTRNAEKTGKPPKLPEKSSLQSRSQAAVGDVQ